MTSLPPPISIVCFGHEELLLRTRREILAVSGMSASTASTMSEFRMQLLDRQPALVLLCHTLSREEWESAAALARSASPRSRILILSAQPLHCLVPVSNAEYLPGYGPDALVGALQQIVFGSVENARSSVGDC